MTLSTATHLNFPGTARAALDFYQRVFGGQVMTTTYAEVGMPAPVALLLGNAALLLVSMILCRRIILR